MFRVLVIMYLAFLGGLGYLLRSEMGPPVQHVTHEVETDDGKYTRTFRETALQASQRAELQTLNAQIAGQQQELENARQSGNLKRLRNARNKLDTLLARLKTAEGGTSM